MLAGNGTSYTSALAVGGESPSYTTNTEEWNGTNWTEVNNLNTARNSLRCVGNNTEAMLAVGGSISPGKTGKTEEWNGVSWTEVADLATARSNVGASGSSTAGLAFGGNTPTKTGATEEWNGAGAGQTRTFTDS